MKRGLFLLIFLYGDNEVADSKANREWKYSQKGKRRESKSKGRERRLAAREEWRRGRG